MQSYVVQWINVVKTHRLTLNDDTACTSAPVKPDYILTNLNKTSPARARLVKSDLQEFLVDSKKIDRINWVDHSVQRVVEPQY